MHSQLLRWHLQRADGIVVVSDPVGEQVRDLARPRIPIVVAPNAPTGRLAVNESSTREQSSLPSKFFLTVGSVEPRKNLIRLVQAHRLAMRRVAAPIPLLVAGGSADVYRDALRGQEVSDQVHLLGRVTDSELAHLYARCTAFVSVSLGEGFGLPVVEASAATNAPLVLSDIPAYRWLMTADGGTVFVDPLSIESIAAGLVDAGTSERRLPRRTVAERFTWKRSAQMISDFIDDVVN